MLETLELSPGDLLRLGGSFKYSFTGGAAWGQAAAELWQRSMTPGVSWPHPSARN